MLKKIKKKEKKVDREMRERIWWVGCSANGRDSIAVELESPPFFPFLDFLFSWSWLMYMANY
jgi:hypothetical protein